MAFNDRLKEARIANGLTQKQLAEKLGIAGTTVTGYEKGNSEPNVNTIGKIMEVLRVDANFLWQDEMKELSTKDFSISEIKIIKKYRKLDTHGKKIVDMVLDEEAARCNSTTPIHLKPVAAHNDNLDDEQQHLIQNDLDRLNKL